MFDVQTTRQLGSSFSLRVIILCKCVQTVKIHLPLFILTVFALQVFNGPVPYKAVVCSGNLGQPGLAWQVMFWEAAQAGNTADDL